MPSGYDILIAGAGPAGCAAAYDLARAGRRVLLLDKRAFPRPKACACGLTRKTLAALRYSVDPVIERVCREIVLQPAAPGPAQREVRIRARSPICAMAVRERFDAFCLQQTLHAGPRIELRKIDSIVSLREFPTHIELDVLITGNGEQRTETLHAPVLIGADGSNGQSRRLAASLPANHSEPFPPSTQNASPRHASPSSHGEALSPSAQDWYTHGFALEATVPYAALPSPLPGGNRPHDLVFDFSPLPGGYGWLFPKGDHINIGVGAFAPEEGDSSAKLKTVTRALLLDYTRRKLGVAALDHITGQHLGIGGQNYVPRGRVLLAGDAAGLVDPLTGEGIHSAIVSGQAAAAAILETLHPASSSQPQRITRNREPHSAHSPAAALAAAYARRLASLQQTLAFSERAARAFYADPARGFRAMRLPVLRSLILRTYADGLPHTKLLAALAKVV